MRSLRSSRGMSLRSGISGRASSAASSATPRSRAAFRLGALDGVCGLGGRSVRGRRPHLGDDVWAHAAVGERGERAGAAANPAGGGSPIAVTGPAAGAAAELRRAQRPALPGGACGARAHLQSAADPARSRPRARRSRPIWPRSARHATTSARRSRRSPTARCSSSCWRAPCTMNSICTTRSYAPHNLPQRESSHVDRYLATDDPRDRRSLVREHGSLVRRTRRQGCQADGLRRPARARSRSTPCRGSVEVEGWDRSEVEVTGTPDDLAERVRMSSSGGKTTIHVEPFSMHGGSSDDIHLIVHVPAKSSVSTSLVSAEPQGEGPPGRHATFEPSAATSAARSMGTCESTP